MITASFLVEWAIRSSVLAALAALLPLVARVKDPSIRLAAYTAAVCASLVLPLFIAAVPKVPFAVMPAVQLSSAQPLAQPAAELVGVEPLSRQTAEQPQPVNWGAAAVAAYALVAGALLLRLFAGVLGSRRLRSMSSGTELRAGGVEVLESGLIASPLTVGIVRPVIVLPADWREWNREKLNAVLAHESSHIARRDPTVQFLSAMHRALLWHSPASWMLHRHIVRLAEQASDDAALAATRDRVTYAEVVLDFMKRGAGVRWHGVAMARYGRPDHRIDRILDSPMRSPRVTWAAAAAIVAVGVPLSYLAAAATPARAAANHSMIPAMLPVASAQTGGATARAGAAPASGQTPSATSGERKRSESGGVQRYMIILGNTQSGSWDSRDPVDPSSLRARFGQRFAWFRQNGSERVITDDAVLREIERAMEPQEKVNRAQDRVNQLQNAVNGLQNKVNMQQDGVNSEQNKVNAQQNGVNAAQQQANQRQRLLDRVQHAANREDKQAAVKELEKLLEQLRGQDGATQHEVNRLQSEVNEAQSRVNELQNKVNSEQARVNQEQDKVNREQHLVNEEQRKVSNEFNRRIQEIFESAVRRGVAQPLQ